MIDEKTLISSPNFRRMGKEEQDVYRALLESKYEYNVNAEGFKNIISQAMLMNRFHITLRLFKAKTVSGREEDSGPAVTRAISIKDFHFTKEDLSGLTKAHPYKGTRFIMPGSIGSTSIVAKVVLEGLNAPGKNFFSAIELFPKKHLEFKYYELDSKYNNKKRKWIYTEQNVELRKLTSAQDVWTATPKMPDWHLSSESLGKPRGAYSQGRGKISKPGVGYVKGEAPQYSRFIFFDKHGKQAASEAFTMIYRGTLAEGFNPDFSRNVVKNLKGVQHQFSFRDPEAVGLSHANPTFYIEYHKNFTSGGLLFTIDQTSGLNPIIISGSLELE